MWNSNLRSLRNIYYISEDILLRKIQNPTLKREEKVHISYVFTFRVTVNISPGNESIQYLWHTYLLEIQVCNHPNRNRWYGYMALNPDNFHKSLCICIRMYCFHILKIERDVLIALIFKNEILRCSLFKPDTEKCLYPRCLSSNVIKRDQSYEMYHLI